MVDIRNRYKTSGALWPLTGGRGPCVRPRSFIHPPQRQTVNTSRPRTAALERCHLRMCPAVFLRSARSKLFDVSFIKGGNRDRSAFKATAFLLLRPAVCRKYLYAYKQELLSGAPSVFGRYCSGYYYYFYSPREAEEEGEIQICFCPYVMISSFFHFWRSIGFSSSDSKFETCRNDSKSNCEWFVWSCEELHALQINWLPGQEGGGNHGKTSDSCNQPPVSPIEAAVFVCSDTWSVWPAVLLAGSQASSRALGLSVCLRVKTLSKATPRQSKAWTFLLLQVCVER